MHRSRTPITIKNAGTAFRVGLFWAVLLQSGLADNVSSPVTPIPIREGQTLTATQRAEEPVTYLFEAQAGATYLIEVDQLGLDFIVTVEFPDGTKQSYNSPLKRDEREFVLLEKTKPGAHQITLFSEELTNASGDHRLRVSPLQVNEENEELLMGWRLMTAGAAANTAHTGAESAHRSYAEAAVVWQQLGWTRRQAQALFSVAMINYWDLYDWTTSADGALQVAHLYETIDLPSLKAAATFLRALALLERSNEQGDGDSRRQFSVALALFDESKTTYENKTNRYMVAHIENNIGLTHFSKGELDDARIHWHESTGIFAELGEWREEAQVRQNLAVIDIERGYSDRAIVRLQTIIDALPPEKDPEFRAIVLDNLGAAHREFGNSDEALQAFSTALGLHRESGDRHGEGWSLRGIGTTYYVLGELELAESYLTDALNVAKEVKDGRTEAGILTNLGNIQYLKANHSSALELHNDAVKLTQSASDRASRLVLVSKDLIALGRYREASQHANNALRLAESSSSPVSRADALQELGRSYGYLGKPQLARDSLTRALTIYETLGLEGGQADSLHALSVIKHQAGDFDAALQDGEKALKLLESLRARVAAPDLRAFYSSTRRRYYDTHVRVLIDAYEYSSHSNSTYLEEALTTSERARARMTMDLLAESSVHLRKGIDAKLFQKQQNLLRELSALRHQRDSLVPDPTADVASEALQSTLRKMVATENELNLLETEFRKNSTEYAAFTSPTTLSANEIQVLLDPNTTLLQYSLGDRESFVWIVTNSSLRMVRLASREKIEATVRRTFLALNSFDPSRARRSQKASLQELAGLILTPVSKFLTGEKILISAVDVLQYVPFSLLPVDGGGTPLLMSHEIINVPSVSVVERLRSREGDKEPGRTLAIFADPVFDRADSRLTKTSHSRTHPQTARNELLSRSSGENLGRLVASGTEAHAIGRLVPPTNRMIATGFESSIERLQSLELSDYRFLHFATHGLVDTDYPALSALALSFFDETGAKRDGYLRLNDIYNLKLNADLVVLSACNTALGREIRGEALVGLSQGFIYSGARSLVLTLWQVPDRATSELMVLLYENMLLGSLTPSAALRKAQLSIRSERRWSDPYFWGSFVLFGDWSS